MKSLAFSLGALALLVNLPLHADLLIKPNDRVLVAAEVPLEQGMASVDIAAYFLMCQHVDGVEVIGANEGQEEVEPFMRRVETEIAAWNPTVALISHGGNEGREGREGQSFIKYHPLYLGQTLDSLKKIGVRTIVLGSTSAVDSSSPEGATPAKTYNENLAAFSDEDRDIATKAGVPFADIFTDTLNAMTHAKADFGDAYVFADQGRNLHRNGQLVMAYSFLKALGCDGNIGTITVDMGSNTATGTDGQKILSMKDGAVNVESTRYPYCFTGDPKSMDASTGIISEFPFNQDLNRYQLVVNGLSSAKARVTWGTETRDFDSADLAKGVNLAAAFAGHTPFDGVFSHIVDTLWQQQLKQFIWTHSIIEHLDALKTMAPTADFGQLVTAIHDQDAKNGAGAAAMFVPLQHTLKIEPLP